MIGELEFRMRYFPWGEIAVEVVICWLQTSKTQQFSFGYGQTKHAVVLGQVDAGDDTAAKLYFDYCMHGIKYELDRYCLLIRVDIRCHISQVEVPLRFNISLIANAETIVASHKPVSPWFYLRNRPDNRELLTNTAFTISVHTSVLYAQLPSTPRLLVSPNFTYLYRRLLII